MGAVPVFASASEALDVARAALGYVAAADATGLTSEEQAGCGSWSGSRHWRRPRGCRCWGGVSTAGKGYWS